MIDRQAEIDANYEAFVAELPALMRNRAGKFALMHGRKIVDFFDTARDADVAGRNLFPDGIYSVQQVVEAPVDLGFFSHVVPSGLRDTCKYTT